MRMLPAIFLVLVCATAAPAAAQQIRQPAAAAVEQKVEGPSGKSFTGTLGAGETITYDFFARQGDRLHIALGEDKPVVEFKLLGPGGETSFDTSKDFETAEGARSRSPRYDGVIAKSGPYKVIVYRPRKDAEGSNKIFYALYIRIQPSTPVNIVEPWIVDIASIKALEAKHPLNGEPLRYVGRKVNGHRFIDASTMGGCGGKSFTYDVETDTIGNVTLWFDRACIDETASLMINTPLMSGILQFKVDVVEDWTPDAKSIAGMQAWRPCTKNGVAGVLPCDLSQYGRYYVGSIVNGKKVIDAVVVKPVAAADRGVLHIGSYSGDIYKACSAVRVRYNVETDRFDRAEPWIDRPCPRQ